MAPNRIISVFLPIFFSALVVCGIVLCTCALCHRPHYLTYFSFGRGRGNVDGSDITDSTGSSSSGTSSSDAEKGHGRGPSRPQKAAYAKQQKRGKSQKRPGGYGRVPQVMDRRTVSFFFSLYVCAVTCCRGMLRLGISDSRVARCCCCFGVAPRSFQLRSFRFAPHRAALLFRLQAVNCEL